MRASESEKEQGSESKSGKKWKGILSKREKTPPFQFVFVLLPAISQTLGFRLQWQSSESTTPAAGLSPHVSVSGKNNSPPGPSVRLDTEDTVLLWLSISISLSLSLSYTHKGKKVSKDFPCEKGEKRAEGNLH